MGCDKIVITIFVVVVAVTFIIIIIIIIIVVVVVVVVIRVQSDGTSLNVTLQVSFGRVGPPQLGLALGSPDGSLLTRFS